MGIDDRYIHGSPSSASHACKPSLTPHYISHSAPSLCTPHSLSFHADTSDAHDTPDTHANAFDGRMAHSTWAFLLFLPSTPALPFLSQNKQQTPDSCTRVQRPLPHVLLPITTLYLLLTSRTHTFPSSAPHSAEKEKATSAARLARVPSGDWH